VRKLAERVNVATQEITDNIGGMISLVRETQTENQVINDDIGQTRQVVERSSVEFRRMVGDFERTGDQLNQIASAMEELTATNAQVHEAVAQVHELSIEVAGSMQSSEQSTQTLSQATESVQELVSRFKIGRGAFDFNVERARLFRDAVQDKLDALARSGVNIWDQTYRPQRAPDPQKYEVSYCRAFEHRSSPCSRRRCSAAARRRLPYALIIDTRGYGAHPQPEIPRPLTAIDQNDLVAPGPAHLGTSPRSAARRTRCRCWSMTYARIPAKSCRDQHAVIVAGRHWALSASAAKARC
jgi:methyl-accepting chemotaxis protein